MKNGQPAIGSADFPKEWKQDHIVLSPDPYFCECVGGAIDFCDLDMQRDGGLLEQGLDLKIAE
jgi:hypothetical protein